MTELLRVAATFAVCWAMAFAWVLTFSRSEVR